MASLVEDLIGILEEEEKVYQKLAEIGEQKRLLLIQNDVPALEKLTASEQLVADEALSLSNKQVQALSDIANVLGKSEEKMTVSRLIELLNSQPVIQDRLKVAKEHLLAIAGEVQRLNQQNEALINQAMELAEFDITLFKSMRQAPETANYNKSAYNTGALLSSSGFDAKQ